MRVSRQMVVSLSCAVQMRYLFESVGVKVQELMGMTLEVLEMER